MQVVNKKRVIHHFDGKFKESFGCPEQIAKWFITGPSFSGKSSFVFKLCRYLTRFVKIDYFNFEEGDSQTVSDKIVEHGLLDKEVEGKFKILPKLPLHLVKERMAKRGAAGLGVIDSVQHSQMSKHTYLEFVDAFCVPKKGKSMIFINHWLKNDLTKHIKHDCDIKIEVIGFVAHVESRYGGGKPFIIWEDGAKQYWKKKYKMVADGKYWPGQKR